MAITDIDPEMLQQLGSINKQLDAILQPEDPDSYAALSRRVGSAAAGVALAAGLTASPVAAGEAPQPVGTYTIDVAAGDTLSQIAKAHETSPQAIQAANGIVDPDVIREDTDLIVPHMLTARVGDSYWRIAERELPGASDVELVQRMVQLQSLKGNPRVIQPGDAIYLSEQQDETKVVTVEEGSSPHSIAEALYTDDAPANEVKLAQTIIQANNLTVIDGIAQVHPGDELIVPLAQPIAAVETAPQVQPLTVVETPQAKEVESRNYDYGAIPEINGVNKQLIQDVMKYLEQNHKLTLKGAAYLTGNFIQESSLNPNATGDNGTATGLAQWRFERQQGMPEGDLYGQIDFALNTEIDRDGMAANLNELLKDPNATDDQLQNAIRRWERYGHAGNRFAYAQQIEQAVVSAAAMAAPVPQPEAPRQTLPQEPAVAEISAEETHPEPVKSSAESVATHPHQEFIDRHKLSKYPTIINYDTITTGVQGKREAIISTVEVMGAPVNIEIAHDLAGLIERAHAEGIDLQITSGHRTHEKQGQLRIENDCPDVNISPASSCRVPTARPGESNHNSGEAADFNNGGQRIDDDTFAWLKDNAPDFGFYNLPSEPWHWSRNGK